MPFTYERKSIFATLPRTERAHALVLGSDPKGKTFLYTNDYSVFIRDIENPKICDVYCEHGYRASAAKYAPSGFYIASGDVSGRLRIWDTTQKEHILKYEHQPLSGKINDICWSPDSKRIAVCGDGRDRFAAAILWDTGTSVGKLEANGKICNAIDFKPTRPFRVVVASDDMTTAYYEGPPFKETKVLRDHTRFVHTTRYSPDGNFFATGGSDSKVFVYTGKEGDLSFELKDGENSHKGGVYSVCFSPDSSQLMTASADGTVKLWDVATQQVVTTFVLGTTLEDQQLSCLWQGNYLLSSSLSGFINYLDKNNPEKPLRIIKGHNMNISALSLSSDKKTIYSCGLDQYRTHCWDADTGECEVATGTPHKNMVTGMCTSDNMVVSVGMDDKIRFVDMEKQEYTDDVIGLDKQPLCVDTSGDLMAVGTVEGICLFRDKTQIATEKTTYEAKGVSLSPSGALLAVGGSDKKVHIFDVTAGELKEVDQLTTLDQVCAVQFSPSGEYVACVFGKRIQFWTVEGFMPSKIQWSVHDSRITSLAWSPDSKRIATAAMDGCIGVLDVIKPEDNNIIKAAHPKSVISSVAWRDNTTIVSASHDKCIKQWSV